MARLSLKLSQTNYLYTPTYFKIIEILTHDYLFSPSHLVSKTKACHCCDIKIFDAFEWHWSHSQKSIQDITYLLDITKEEKMKKKPVVLISSYCLMEEWSGYTDLFMTVFILTT